MTDAEKKKCHAIIHAHAVAAAAGNAVPVPGLGMAVDLVTMTTMAMSLAAVFGGSVSKSVAQNMALLALKRKIMEQPVKAVVKELSKLIPWAGSAVSATISVAMLESAGWILASDLEKEVLKQLDNGIEGI